MTDTCQTCYGMLYESWTCPECGEAEILTVEHVPTGDHTMETLDFSEIQPIKPYVAPDWFVEFDGSTCRGADINAELVDTEVEIIETDLVGWGYDVIISVTSEWGQSHFLANR